MRPEDLEVAFTWFNELNIVSQLATNQFERSLPDDMTVSQFSVLNWFIRVDTEATPARLATAFQVTRGAMTNTLKKLEQKGYVAIRPNEDSGRSKLVTLTPAGSAARLDAMKAAGPLLAEFVDRFGTKSITAQLPLIQEIRAYLDERRYR